MKKSRMKFVVVTLICLGFVVASECSASEDLVGWWTFDEEAGNIAHDSSENNNDGNFGGETSRRPLARTPGIQTCAPTTRSTLVNGLTWHSVTARAHCPSTSTAYYWMPQEPTLSQSLTRAIPLRRGNNVTVRSLGI